MTAKLLFLADVLGVAGHTTQKPYEMNHHYKVIDAPTPRIFGRLPSLVEKRSSETGTYKCRS